MSMRIIPLLLLLSGCAAHAPRFPGPLHPLGKGPAEDLPGVVAAEWLEAEEETEEEHAPAVASVEAKPASPPSAPRSSKLGNRAADAAEHYLKHKPSGFRDDCSGYVCAVYNRAGLPLQGNSRSLWEDARRSGALHYRKRPQPGDIAFFDNTYDRNKNGRRDDILTHVAVVISIDADGTIVLGHGGTSKGRTTLTMNLLHPSVHKLDDGTLLNDYLRARRSGEKGAFLSGELWRGFATPSDDDGWSLAE